jgi:histone acetyltransferase (RNA polymerase elongator complex component)
MSLNYSLIWIINIIYFQQRILADPDLQADQWKLYPCQVVPWTTIEKWHEEGVYTPYEPSVLIDLLIEIKRRVHPWIRLNRVVRDIPNQV